MLNDVRPPPLEIDSSRDVAHARGLHVQPRVDTKEPGQHHSRSMGEPTRIEPVYSMPMEERGSTFNIAMSIVAIGLFAVLIVSAWWSLK